MFGNGRWGQAPGLVNDRTNPRTGKYMSAQEAYDYNLNVQSAYENQKRNEKNAHTYLNTPRLAQEYTPQQFAQLSLGYNPNNSEEFNKTVQFVHNRDIEQRKADEERVAREHQEWLNNPEAHKPKKKHGLNKLYHEIKKAPIIGDVAKLGVNTVKAANKVAPMLVPFTPTAMLENIQSGHKQRSEETQQGLEAEQQEAQRQEQYKALVKKYQAQQQQQERQQTGLQKQAANIRNQLGAFSQNVLPYSNSDASIRQAMQYMNLQNDIESIPKPEGAPKRDLYEMVLKNFSPQAFNPYQHPDVMQGMLPSNLQRNTAKHFNPQMYNPEQYYEEVY